MINLLIGFGDRIEPIVIGRPHPITIYDLQVELQQRFNIPLLEQIVYHDRSSLTQYSPNLSLDAIGIRDNSFISLWSKNFGQNYQYQSNDYYSPRQQAPLVPYSVDGSQTVRSNELSPR